ncbi:hypothetical protein ACF0H5_000140 [Mactra antiquata]
MERPYQCREPSCDNANTQMVSNVALGKSAFQSSTLESYVASNAVDGNINGNIGASSCMHTEGMSLDTYWEVDLGGVYVIVNVVLYNRLDCCGDRTRNVQVFVGFDQNDYVLLGYLEGLLGSQHTFQMDTHTYGRWVRITRDSVPDEMNFCELEVYGELLTNDHKVRYGQLPNKIGVGTVLRSVSGSSMVDCAVRCKTSNNCAGFNFDSSTLDCTTLGTATTSDNVQEHLYSYHMG